MSTTIPVLLENLLFDPRNPRLVGDFAGDQGKMFRFLITDIGVDDLLRSISTSGLYDADPIIARSAGQSGKYFVVEGNRRLAALKLLSGERPADEDPLPTIPTVAPEIAKTFKEIKIQTGWNASDLAAYLGYKHVTSSREWTPDAKAKFVYESAKNDLSESNLRKYARSLGTRYPTLLRWLSAYLVLKQAQELKFFDSDQAPSRGYFGTFYTLLGGKKAQAFLGLKDDMTKPLVPEDKTENLKDFVSWTIGSKSQPSIVNSRQQKEFEQVLGSANALSYLRLRRDLNGSLFYTEFNAEQIAERLLKAHYMINDCLINLFDVRDDARVTNAFESLENSVQKARVYMTAQEPHDK